jgi:FAD/FMN-containing dehydrogenase/Fe-S oxidoreductase
VLAFFHAEMSDYQDLQHALRKRLAGEVRFDDMSRWLYSTDASIYQIEPVGVVIPKVAEEVDAAFEVAREHGVPVLARGGGTSLAGQTVGHAVVIDFSKYLNRVLEINPEERWARVQPGVVLDQLNAAVRPHGLLFGPDTATSNRANLGGMIGNNSAGARSILYGMTADHVPSLKALLSDGTTVTLEALDSRQLSAKLKADGLEGEIYRAVQRIVQEHRVEIVRRFPKILRRVSGYSLDAFVDADSFNLAKLIVGSEGTLAIVTEARLNLLPRPSHRALGVIHFHDLFAALEAVNPIVELKPSAVELIDRKILEITRRTVEHARRLTFVEGDPDALLLVEFQGDTASEVAAKVEELSRFCERQRFGYAMVRALSEQEQANIWYVRKAGAALVFKIRGERKPIAFVEDTAVAPERLPEYIRRFDAIVREHDTEAAIYAHASVGCLHIRPLINVKLPAEVEKMRSIAEQVSELVVEFGGAMSGEHGDGLARSQWNERLFGSELYQAFREIKQAFDPRGLLNPGKIVDAPPMTENLRQFGRGPFPAQPFLDFSREGGLGAAIELCNGNGACRKTDSGTMCPSYMVTLDEEHSTRARANALRAILTGHLAADQFTSRRLYEVLDLCVLCKGCKAECPTEVDVAKLKTEFLYHYYQNNRRPWRDYLFGHIHTASKWGSRFAPLSNWLVGSSLGRAVTSRALGIAPQRQLPRFSGRSFRRWFAGRPMAAVEDRPRVVLFVDTFMEYNDPAIGIAATRVLEAAGYSVILAGHKCCGRPMLSKGFLPQARRLAEHNLKVLLPFVEDGIPIVGCEPSCLLALREEYPDLLPSEDARRVAQHTFLIDEFIVREAEKGRFVSDFDERQTRILLHGHCHQKALVGIEPTVRFLSLAPQTTVEVVDSGCCGMAGAFGFEKEHFEVSLAMAERRLFPAVREKGEGWEVVAPGTSCRQQIAHGTGRRAWHPVELLARRLCEGCP